MKRGLRALAVAVALSSCAHTGDWRARDADERAIRIAAYRQFLVSPDTGAVNCLGVQTESRFPGGREADETVDTLAAFHTDPELVAPASACKRNDPSHLPLRHRGE